MPLGWGRFLDRVGGDQALLGSAGAWQPMVCGNKGEGKQLPAAMCPGSATSLSLLDKEHTFQPITWLHLALALGFLVQTSPCPTGGKGVLWSPRFPINTPFLASSSVSKTAAAWQDSLMGLFYPDGDAAQIQLPKISSAMKGPASQK